MRYFALMCSLFGCLIASVQFYALFCLFPFPNSLRTCTLHVLSENKKEHICFARHPHRPFRAGQVYRSQYSFLFPPPIWRDRKKTPEFSDGSHTQVTPYKTRAVTATSILLQSFFFLSDDCAKCYIAQGGLGNLISRLVTPFHVTNIIGRRATLSTHSLVTGRICRLSQ